MPKKERCPDCAGTRWKPAVGPNGSSGVEPCHCRPSAPVPASLAEVGVPLRFRDNARFEYFDEKISEDLRRAKQTVRKWADAYPDVETGLVLTGPAGVGKTHLAVAVLRRILLERKISARVGFLYLPQFLRDGQGSRREVLEAERRCIEWAARAEILVFDQLGADMASRFGQEREEKLLYLLTRCFNNGVLLLCTTVYPFEASAYQPALSERITHRAVSLLREACRTVPIVGQDYRDTVLRHGLGV